MKSLTILLLVLLPFLGISQDKFDYKVSKPYRVIDGAEKYYFSITNNEKTLSVKRDGKDIYMQSFDAKAMKELKREKISDLPKGFVIEHMMWFNSKAYCFFSVWDRKNETEQLFYREIDFHSCAFKGKEKRIIAVKGKLTGAPLAIVGFWSVGTADKFSFLLSQDKSKLLVQCRKKPAKRNDAISKDQIGMYVFDEDMEKIAGNTIEMPYTEQMMDNIDYHIDSEGSPYILAKVRADGSDKNEKGVGKKNKKANYHIELLKVDIPGKKIKISKVAVEGYFIKDIWLYEGTEEHMICAGFYNKKTGSNWSNGQWIGKSKFSDGNADGIFLFHLNKEGGLDKKNFYPIPLEIINQYQKLGTQKRNEKKDSKGKAELSYLDLRELNVQEDGSIIILGEQFYKIYHQSRSGGYYTYHYEDILMTKIDKDGELVWMRKMPKKTYSRRYRGGLGFKHTELDGNHYLFFMDNVKNMDLSLDKRPNTHIDGLGGFLTAYRVNDSTGKVSKVSIFDSKKLDNGYSVKQFYTGKILQISDSEYILELYKGQKEDVMIKIKVQ